MSPLSLQDCCCSYFIFNNHCPYGPHQLSIRVTRIGVVIENGVVKDTLLTGMNAVALGNRTDAETTKLWLMFRGQHDMPGLTNGTRVGKSFPDSPRRFMHVLMSFAHWAPHVQDFALASGCHSSACTPLKWCVREFSEVATYRVQGMLVSHGIFEA
jgi:hypothetical protein